MLWLGRALETAARPFPRNARAVDSAETGSVAMPFVSITRLRVRSWRYLPRFLVGSVAALLQARRTLGNLSASVLRDAHLAFWTRTVWSGEASMCGFMLSGTHRRLMHRLLEWCDQAAIVHWATDAAPPPSWSEAH